MSEGFSKYSNEFLDIIFFPLAVVHRSAPWVSMMSLFHCYCGPTSNYVYFVFCHLFENRIWFLFLVNQKIELLKTLIWQYWYFQMGSFCSFQKLISNVNNTLSKSQHMSKAFRIQGDVKIESQIFVSDFSTKKKA